MYWRHADVMYTNRDNLEHTIDVQQALFRQQLNHGGPAAVARQHPNVGGAASGQATPALEWVVKRRSDGTRYITRRPVKRSPGWRAERRRGAELRRLERGVGTSTDDGHNEVGVGQRDDGPKQVR